MQQEAAKLIVAVGEAICFDADFFSNDSLDREASAVDRRLDRFDDRAYAAVRRRRVRNRHLIVLKLRPQAGLSMTTERGGNVNVSEYGRVCAATGAASTPPKLPMPL